MRNTWDTHAHSPFKSIKENLDALRNLPHLFLYVQALYYNDFNNILDLKSSPSKLIEFEGESDKKILSALERKKWFRLAKKKVWVK